MRTFQKAVLVGAMPGSVDALTGVAGNLLNGEGDPGAQRNHLGSDMGCNNQAL
ncbi:hypothetical protein AB0D38_25465 [Streptomyces sp. NPDC048279]|uniref:hypothetical protein n=1 Tax=Streptomyces sp. NPDC048279 TaxID=3154714 RepID=UPI0034231F39